MNDQYRVHQWQTLNKELIWAYRGPVTEKYRRSSHPPQHNALWFLTVGEVKLECDAGTFEAEEGDFLFIPSCERTQHFSDDAELISIRFLLNDSTSKPVLDCDAPLRLSPRGYSLYRLSKLLADKTEDLFGDLRYEFYKAGGTPRAHLEVEAIFAQFLSELLRVLDLHGIGFRGIGDMDSRVATCIAKIKQSPMDKRWTEAEMAKVAGVSHVHLNRLFQECLGVTSYSWLDGFRLEKACMVLESKMQIKDAAYALGFSSPQHFSTWFRRKTGKTPRAYRKKHS